MKKISGVRAALLAAAFAGPSAHAAEMAYVPLEKTCFYQLFEGKADSKQTKLSCLHPAWLTDAEKEDLKRVTRGYLEDASCLVTIEIERSKLDEAMTAADLVFLSPPQPVTCEIKTYKGPMEITATFAPKVVFKGGAAVEASPGLADVQGVTRVLSWPVVQYVNRSSRITGTMRDMINAYRTHRAKEAAQSKK